MMRMIQGFMGRMVGGRRGLVWILNGGALVRGGLFENGAENGLERGVLDLGQQELGTGRDVLRIPVDFLVVKNIGVGAQGLHEALDGAVAKEIGNGALFPDVFPEVEEFVLLLLGVIQVWVVEERGEVVLLTARRRPWKSMSHDLPS